MSKFKGKKMTAAIREIAISTPQKEAKKITWQEFERKYLSREDGYKYEWIDGVVEKTKRSMDQKQYRILKNLRLLFESLSRLGKIFGGLEAEVDTFFLPKKHRRPDISYFSADQEQAMLKGEMQIPQFVIEIISTNDQMNKAHLKMRNYREASVKVVWHIFPELKEVHVYSGNYLDFMTVCTGKILCSASPALPDFVLSAEDVFKGMA